MKTIIRQIQRILNDDGRMDRDFSAQEESLNRAKDHLRHAAEELVKAANLLSDFLRMRQ